VRILVRILYLKFIKMDNKYFSNYFKAISLGLDSSLYYSNMDLTEPELFFLTIKEILNNLKETKSKIFFFGNGASAAFANHMALDFSKNGKILSRSLSDNALLSALSNDYSYENAMKEFLKIEGVSNHDLVITISSSGNSPNIVSALSYCKENNIKSLALSGLKKDNKSLLLADYSIYVPMKTYGMVECLHQIFLHLILDDFMEIYEWNRIDYQNMSSKDFKL
jgi:D-sedoheptulose 7-phosphate isomerase